MENFADFYGSDDIIVVDEDNLSEAMSDFILDLDDEIVDSLDEAQTEAYEEIVSAAALDGETLEEEELDEAMPKKRVRRDIVQKRQASREHRKVKAKKKIEGRRKRKTASFKRYKKKSKRLGKRGLTATGKRKRTFINKG